jgi:hypothetical protein
VVAEEDGDITIGMLVVGVVIITKSSSIVDGNVLAMMTIQGADIELVAIA